MPAGERWWWEDEEGLLAPPDGAAGERLTWAAAAANILRSLAHHAANAGALAERADALAQALALRQVRLPCDRWPLLCNKLPRHGKR